MEIHYYYSLLVTPVGVVGTPQTHLPREVHSTHGKSWLSPTNCRDPCNVGCALRVKILTYLVLNNKVN